MTALLCSMKYLMRKPCLAHSAKISTAWQNLVGWIILLCSETVDISRGAEQTLIGLAKYCEAGQFSACDTGPTCKEVLVFDWFSTKNGGFPWQGSEGVSPVPPVFIDLNDVHHMLLGWGCIRQKNTKKM